MARIERVPPITIIENGASRPNPLIIEKAVRNIKRDIIGVEIVKKIISFLLLFDKLDRAKRKKFRILFFLEVLLENLLRKNTMKKIKIKIAKLISEYDRRLLKY